jgi:hypothetical protein
MILARLCKEHATSPCPRKQQVLQVHCLGHRSKTALRTSKPPLQLYALHHEVRIRRQATPAQRRFLFRQDLMSIPTTVIFKKFPATSEAASTATTCCHHTSRVLNTLTGYLNDASAKSTTSTLMLTSPTTPQRTLGSSLAAQPSSAKSTKSSTTTSRKAYLPGTLRLHQPLQSQNTPSQQYNDLNVRPRRTTTITCSSTRRPIRCRYNDDRTALPDGMGERPPNKFIWGKETGNCPFPFYTATSRYPRLRYDPKFAAFYEKWRLFTF